MLDLLGGPSIFGSRNLGTASAGAALAIAAVVSSAGAFWGRIAGATVLGAFVVAAATNIGPGAAKPAFDGAARWIDERSQPGDVVIDVFDVRSTPVPLTPLDVYSDSDLETFMPSMPAGPPPWLPLTSLPAPPGPVIDRAFATAGRDGRVFVVGLGDRMVTDGSSLTGIEIGPVERSGQRDLRDSPIGAHARGDRVARVARPRCVPDREAGEVSDGATEELWVEIEPLPERLPAGRGDAVFVFGACFHPGDEVTGLEVLVDGAAHPVTDFGLPRLDIFRRLHPNLGGGEPPVPPTDRDSLEDPEVRCYRSGFWATVPVPARELGSETVIAVRATLEGGQAAVAEVARIGAGPPPLGDIDRSAPADPEAARIAVVMATHNPDMDLFRAQVHSLREQTDRNWVCVVSDDRSRPDRFREIAAEIAGDERFVLERGERRLGFYQELRACARDGARRRRTRGALRPGRSLVSGEAGDPS